MQEGRPGERVATYSVKTSIFKLIFGIDGNKKEVSSKTNVAPVEKVVINGTKKYQYMLCSDRSYRYYNDDQFKDPSIGFTGKSEDFCAKFNQGTKVKLADDSSGGVQYSPATQSNPYSRQQPIDSSCTKTDVVKYKTTYRDDPYLAKGVQKTAIDGYDGYTFLCPSIGYKDIAAPRDAVVDVGTGEAAERRAEADRIADEQQRLNEANARNDRIAQCIRNVRVQIPQGGSALEYATSLCYRTP